MVDLIVNKAAVELFNTPVPSVIPTDSFAEDYDLDYKKNGHIKTYIQGNKIFINKHSLSQTKKQFQYPILEGISYFDRENNLYQDGFKDIIMINLLNDTIENQYLIK